MSVTELQEILKSNYPAMDAVGICPEDLVYEERVRLKCFQCRNYSTNRTCPGHLPPFDYRQIISEYAHMAVIINRTATGGDQVSEVVFRQSGNELHRAMLFLESELLKRGNPLAQSFIGGSCQLCENGCPADRCARPEQARVPWDATGCNVVQTLAKIGIEVVFPPKDYICQYGLFLW